MKDDKVLKATLVFILVIQTALLIFFVAEAVHSVALGNVSDAVQCLILVSVSIFSCGINVYSLMD